MTLVLKCCCCQEDLHEEDQKFCAEFGGKLKTVCKDCGIGIYNGLQILNTLNVAGEYRPEQSTR